MGKCDPHIVKIDIHGRSFSLLSLFVHDHLFYMGKIFYGFDIFPGGLACDPTMPAPFLQLYPLHLIFPRIIKQPAQQG